MGKNLAKERKMSTIWSIIVTILVGALVGWLAGLIMKSKHGFWMNALLGIIGGAIGSGIASLLKLNGNWIVSILIGIGGTMIVIALVRLIMGKKW